MISFTESNTGEEMITTVCGSTSRHHFTSVRRSIRALLYTRGSNLSDR